MEHTAFTIRFDESFEKYIKDFLKDNVVTVEKVAEMIAERTQTASDAIDEAVTEALDDRLINAIEESLDDNVLTEKINRAVEQEMENVDFDDVIRNHFRYGVDPSEYMDMSDYAMNVSVDKLIGRIEKLEATLQRLADALVDKPAAPVENWNVVEPVKRDIHADAASVGVVLPS